MTIFGVTANLIFFFGFGKSKRISSSEIGKVFEYLEKKSKNYQKWKISVSHHHSEKFSLRFSFVHFFQKRELIKEKLSFGNFFELSSPLHNRIFLPFHFPQLPNTVFHSLSLSHSFSDTIYHSFCLSCLLEFSLNFLRTAFWLGGTSSSSCTVVRMPG